MPIQPYHTYRYGPNRRKIRTDWVHPSTYEIRIAESEGTLISLSIRFWSFNQQLFAGGTIAEDPAQSSVSESSAQPPISKDTSIAKNILVQERMCHPSIV